MRPSPRKLHGRDGVTTRARDTTPRARERVRCKHVRDLPAATDGTRFLVDRLWPRGIRKGDVAVSAWLREVAPSDKLRRWFRHDPERWPEFQRRYLAELGEHPAAVEPLLDAARKGTITLVHASSEREYNNAVALAAYLRRRLRPRAKLNAARAARAGARRAGGAPRVGGRSAAARSGAARPRGSCSSP
jgi:uncharacterized protein YeaO (DUF488 family)